jgi:hypothetical protein
MAPLQCGRATSRDEAMAAQSYDLACQWSPKAQANRTRRGDRLARTPLVLPLRRPLLTQIIF